MPLSYIDHLVVTAPDLESGNAWVESQLGVRPEPGGQHPCMGTHNSLLRLGDELYLEVIAIDPQAASPQRPRWFGLDHLPSVAAPRLATWVCRTHDIRAATSVWPSAAGHPGTIELMHRGSLEWQITIPADGSLPLDGIAPLLIQWHTATHPSSRLSESGLSLVTLEGHHAGAAHILEGLEAIGFSGPVDLMVQPATTSPRLSAVIRTPSGIRRLLSSPVNA